MNDKYIINNFFYLDKYYENLHKDKKTYTYEEANKIIIDNLYKKDHSSKLKNIKPIEIPSKLLNYKQSKTIKSYSYNILKYNPRLSGFNFNIAIIVWNKETKEYIFKFMNDEDVKKITNIMPKTNFIFDIKENLDSFFKNEKNIEDIKKMILNHGSGGYPLEYYFKFDTWNCYNQYDNDSIDDVANEIYDSYIDFIFKS